MDKRVLIGSRAAKHWFPDFRSVKDADYLIDGEGSSTRSEELHDCNQSEGTRLIFDRTEAIASPETLYTLKVSHSFWNIHWRKTMDDILFFQKKSIPLDEELLSILYKGWEQVHGRKKVNLKKDNDMFFEDGVERKYVHDDLHEAVAYYDMPMYNKIKRDKSSAYVDHDMFLELSFEDQLKLCREEIYVVALERFLIPKDFTLHKRVAYQGACRKLVTSMTKGWFPMFIVRNWVHLSIPDNHDFVGKFHAAFSRET